MNTSRPFLIDSICFAALGAVLAYIFWIANAGNATMQVAMALMLAVPFGLAACYLGLIRRQTAHRRNRSSPSAR